MGEVEVTWAPTNDGCWVGWYCVHNGLEYGEAVRKVDAAMEGDPLIEETVRSYGLLTMARVKESRG